MKVFLIRHGEQEYPYDEQGRKLVSSPDAPLVELGRTQMRGLGRKLAAEGKTYEELEKIGGDIYGHPFNENQETLDHLVNRSRTAIEFILADAKKRGYESVGIVGHGDPLCALDWSIRHEGYPSSYAEMKKEFYPQKGEAYEYTIDPDLRIIGEGRIITTEAAKQTFESFRNSSR